MGHTSTEMLFRVYSRYVPNLTRRDGSAMERLLAQHISVTPVTGTVERVPEKTKKSASRGKKDRVLELTLAPLAWANEDAPMQKTLPAEAGSVEPDELDELDLSMLFTTNHANGSHGEPAETGNALHAMSPAHRINKGPSAP